MKRIITLFIAIILSISVFASCGSSKKSAKTSNEEETYNPFDVDKNKVVKEVQFGFGPVNSENEVQYSGKSIEKEYYYDNVGDTDCEFGFMIFIDGIPQGYKIDGKDNEEIMHKFNVGKKGKIKFKVSFNPNIGKKGDCLGMYAVTIYNPDYVPTKDLNDFGFNYAMSQVLPIEIKYNEASINSSFKVNSKYIVEDIDEKVKTKYKDKGKFGKYVEKKEQSFYLNYNDDHDNIRINCKNNSRVNFSLDGICGIAEAKYRTTMFIDNKLVETSEGDKYLEMELKHEKISKQNFEINTKNITGKHVVYTLSVPVGDSYKKLTNPVVKSPCKLLIIGD